MEFSDYMLVFCDVAVVLFAVFVYWFARRAHKKGILKPKEIPLEQKYAAEIAAGEAVVVKGKHESNYVYWVVGYFILLYFYISFNNSMFKSCSQVLGVSWEIVSSAIVLIFVICMAVGQMYLTIRNYRLAVKDGYEPARTKKFMQDTVCFKLNTRKIAEMRRRRVVMSALCFMLVLIPFTFDIFGQYGLRNHFGSFTDMNSNVQADCVAHHQLLKSIKPMS